MTDDTKHPEEDPLVLTQHFGTRLLKDLLVNVEARRPNHSDVQSDQPLLRFLSGPHEGRVVELGKEPMALGRAEDNDIVLDDIVVSRHHARLVPTGRSFVITDDGRRNKPTVNGVAICGAQLLLHRDLLTVGTSILEFWAPKATPTDEARFQTVQLKRPRFAFQNQVVTQWKLSIGNDPSTDLFLDHEDIDPSHAEVRFQESTDANGSQFHLRDVSQNGTYLNSKRIIDAPLFDGDTVRIGPWKLTFHIDALRCSIHTEAPSPLAQKSTDTASPTQDKPTRKPPPKWRAPDDIKSSKTLPTLLLIGVLSAALLMVASAKWSSENFWSTPLSNAHNSTTFITWTETQLETEPGCSNCHTPFKGVSSERCQSCHEAQHPQAAHASSGVQMQCTDCHTEHERDRTKVALLEGAKCASCHHDRHQKLFAVTPGPIVLNPAAVEIFPSQNTVDMPPSLQAGLSVETIHAVHDGQERRCAGCHANADQTGPVDPKTSCLRCHQERDRLNAITCNACHLEHSTRLERAALVAEHTEPATEAFKTPKPARNVGMLLGLLFGPLLVLAVLFAAVRAMISARTHSKEQPSAPPEQEGVLLIHTINLDKCVGCSSCVNVCPGNVLELNPKNHKSTVVRFEDCIQCRACEQTCPSGALTMAPDGAPPRMIDLPDVDAHYMTTIHGLYLIGEAVGKPLVKNANNLGRRVVEHMRINGLSAGLAADQGFDVEVIVVGSGPGGLAAGITARRAGLSHIVFEKEKNFAPTIRDYPKGKSLLAEPEGLANIGPLTVRDTTREELLEVWEHEIAASGIDLRLDEPVNAIEPHGEGFVVTTPQGTWTCLRVVLATGTRGSPRKLNVPGGALDKIHYNLDDPAEHRNLRSLVVGGGDSAVEAAIALADACVDSEGCVAISYRRNAFTRIKERNREQLEDWVERGNIVLHLETKPIAINSTHVVLKANDDSTFEVPNDRIFCMLGADPPTQWLKKIGVAYTQKPESWDPGPTDDLAFLATAQQHEPPLHETCAACGTSISDAHNFCGVCGHAIAEEQPPPEHQARLVAGVIALDDPWPMLGDITKYNSS